MLFKTRARSSSRPNSPAMRRAVLPTTIASAVEEQGAATQEIARNVQQASAGTAEVSSNIVNVTKAANDTGALYIDPTTVDGSGDTPYVAATTQGTDATTIAALALRQGTAANAATLTSVDNYRAFLSPVPEPTSLTLCGLALIGGWRLRRRFKK